MVFHIITLFPHSFDSYLGESILKRAIEDKKIKVHFYNPRDYAENKHDRVDRKPYGGGPGMVIQALPVIKAIEAALRKCNVKRVTQNGRQKTQGRTDATRSTPHAKLLWLTPSGKQFDNAYARKAVQKHEHIIIVCGRYEGIDARVKKAFKMDEITIGPFVLTGGELPAMLIIDVMARQVEGVLGDFNSLEDDRVASPDVYTRPDMFLYKKKVYRVPNVLLSGHHGKIEEWRSLKKHVRKGGEKNLKS